MLMRRLKDLLFPPRCALCDAVIAPRERPLCPACGRACPDVSILGEVCRTCGREKLCCTCKEDSFLSDGIAAPFYYEGVARRGVSLYKRVQDVDRTAFFVKEMANSICRSLGDRIVDVITAVPMRPAEGVSYPVCAAFAQMSRYAVAKAAHDGTEAQQSARCI